MTTEEQIAQLAAEFKARSAKWKAEREPLPPGHSGPLNVEPLPEDVVDAMEAAIEEAFEQVNGDEPQRPHGILSDYCGAAMRHAIYRRVRGEQERVYGAIPGMSGLWARGFTRAEAERDLREALEWWVLTAVFEHRPLPEYDGVALEIVEESEDGATVVYPVASSSDESFIDDMEGEAEPVE